MTKVPRVLYTYWHQGLSAAPAVVKACVAHFRQLNPGWSVQMLDAETAKEVVSSLPMSKTRWSKLNLAHQSDLIRTRLLIDHGGVWIDPTVFLNVPLDDWLPKQMGSGLFLFHRPGRDRIISNWLIAAEPDNLLLRRLFDRLWRYWQEYDFPNPSPTPSRRALIGMRILNRNLWLPRLWLRPSVVRLLKTTPYMVYHYTFYELIKSDPECAEIWNRTPKVSAVPPHRLQRLGLVSPLTDEARRIIDEPEAPVFKLTWKLPQDDIPAGTVLDYLLDQNRHSYPQAEKVVHE